MNIALVCFSQTGQTVKVAEAMAEALRGKEHSVRVLDMRRLERSDIVDCDVLGVGAPSFESQAPAPVKAWIRSWPALNGKPAFVFSTSGGTPGNTLYDLTRALRAKGGKVMGGFMCRGTVHHPAPCLHGRMPQRPDAGDLARARAFALDLERYLANGVAGDMPIGRRDALEPTVGFYQLVGLVAKPFLMRVLLPEPNLDEGLCTQCRLCADECPVQNITLSPYPVLGNRCIRCYRCQTVCPQGAFSESWRYGNPVILTLYNTTFARIFGDLEPGERVY